MKQWLCLGFALAFLVACSDSSVNTISYSSSSNDTDASSSVVLSSGNTGSSEAISSNAVSSSVDPSSMALSSSSAINPLGCGTIDSASSYNITWTCHVTDNIDSLQGTIGLGDTAYPSPTIWKPVWENNMVVRTDSTAPLSWCDLGTGPYTIVDSVFITYAYSTVHSDSDYRILSQGEIKYRVQHFSGLTGGSTNYSCVTERTDAIPASEGYLFNFSNGSRIIIWTCIAGVCGYQ